MKRLLLALGAGIVLYYAVYGGEYSALDVRSFRGEVEEARVELEQTRAEVERLEARVDSLAGDEAALERVARERYGMIRSGEILYRFVPEDDDGREASHRE